MLTFENDSDESLKTGPTNFNSEWDKLLLLMWKNIRVLWSNWEQFMMTILVPIFFCTTLVLLRLSLNVERSPVENYPLLEINDFWRNLMATIDERKAKIKDNIDEDISNPFIPEKIVGYAPQMPGYTNIMKGASDSLESLIVKSYTTCDQLRKALIKENLLAGVCFTSYLNDDRNINRMIGGLYPIYMNYRLIFPFACRIYYDTFIGISWNTNSLYHFINRTDQRNIGQADGGYIGYLREGFVPLQNAISMSYIKLVADLTTPNFNIPKIVMNRFPSKEFQKDDLIESVDFSVSLLIVLGNFYPVLMFIARIVSEKETTLKSYTKIMGISNYVHSIGWTCNYLIRALISSFVIVVLLKIKWSEMAILERSNFFALLLVISVYNITSISFVLMIAPFYEEIVFALSGTALAWFVTYIPYIVSLNEDQDAWYLRFWVVVFHNTTLGFAIETILNFELFGQGLTFENFFDTDPLRRTFSVGTFICIMVMQCFIYIGISLYLEEIKPGKFGLAKRWYFLFTTKISPLIPIDVPGIRQTVVDTDSELRGSHIIGRLTPMVYEVAGSGSVAVQLQNVCKAYGDDYVLRNINLQLSDNEITILMGHNGSGKTTLLTLMSGLLPMTSGTIVIEGFDLSVNQRYACASLGLCLGSTLLYPDLTVEDQIRFFSYLKGMQGDSVELALEHYLKATKLTDYRIKLTKYLPMGVLQKLAICCALVGRSRVILLDNPTSHMDLPARTLIWKLLESEKLNRTILITATSANVLEDVGDRVVILSDGVLQCSGTPVFIKNMYGQGYRLVVTQAPDCNIEAVTSNVREFVPKITPLCSLGNEIIYDLNEGDSDIFDQLLVSLNENMSDLGIQSVTLRPINMDDIFFKVAAVHHSRENRTRLMEIMNGQSSYPEESEHLRFMEIEERVTGMRRNLLHCQAMWGQRFIYATYFSSHYIRRLIYSPLFVITAFYISSFSSNLAPMTAMEFSLNQYPSSVTLIETRNFYNESEPILQRYKELIYWVGVKHKLEFTEDAIISDYYVNKEFDTKHPIDLDHHVGVTFAADYIIAWFNNVALHSVPLSLNMVHNAILRAIYGEQSGIDVTLEPLNNMQNYRDGLLRTPISTSHILPLCIAMCVCCIWNTMTFKFVREIQSGYDKAQIMAGAKFLTYWFVNLAHDSLVIVLTSILVSLTIMFCQYDLYVPWRIYYSYAFIFTLCGWCVYALNYTIALCFESPVHAFTFSLSIEAFSITCFCHIIEAFEKHYGGTQQNDYATYFMVLPLFSFCTSISTIYFSAEFQRICRNDEIRFISINVEKCQAIPNCCITFDLFSFKNGILLEILVMSVMLCICWCFIFTAHFRYFWNFGNIPEDDYEAQLSDHKRRHDDSKDDSFGDESSFQEQYQIQKMKNADLRRIPLVSDRLGKNFGQKVAVDRISLALHRYNCFGLLGFSGSGVTTFFNLISGFNGFSYGRVLINGQQAIHNLFLVQKMVGYGRQSMPTFPELTVKSVLEYVCRLRSYPEQYVDEICVNLAKVMGIFPCYEKHLNVLSLGVLNRLNCAVAVMGNPKIILLDMAIASIDSAGKRSVWHILKRMQSTGATILVSTTSLRDCERYCNRVGFMSHGRLSVIGTPWSLSKLFAENHYLIVKVNRRMPRLNIMSSSNYLLAAGKNKLTAFIHKEFPNSILKEQRGSNLVFLIPSYGNSILKIYSSLMHNAYMLNIEDFDLAHSLLSQTFMQFWEREYGAELGERFSIE